MPIVSIIYDAGLKATLNLLRDFLPTCRKAEFAFLAGLVR
jgi:hypothetical protein